MTPPDTCRDVETLVRQQRGAGELAGLVESAPCQHDLHPQEVARRQLQGVTHLLGDGLGSVEQLVDPLAAGSPASWRLSASVRRARACAGWTAGSG